MEIARSKITSDPPGATIYEGGRVIGTTPFVHSAPKENRTIELIAELAGHNDVSFTINPLVDDGKPVQVRLKKPKRGRKAVKIRKTKSQPDKNTGQGGSTTSGDKQNDSSGTAGGELGGNPYKPHSN